MTIERKCFLALTLSERTNLEETKKLLANIVSFTQEAYADNLVSDAVEAYRAIEKVLQYAK